MKEFPRIGVRVLLLIGELEDQLDREKSKANNYGYMNVVDEVQKDKELIRELKQMLIEKMSQ